MEDLTTGPVSRHLLKTMSFMLVSMVFQTLYVLVDLYWVGRLGTEAVAAVAVSGNLAFVVLGITQTLGVGITTLISHAAGRKDRERALLLFNQGQILSMIVGAAFLIVATAFSDQYARRFSADAETAALAVAYLRWFIPAMALQFALVAMGASLRGHRPVQARDDRPDRDHRDQHRAGADLHLRMGHGIPAFGVAGAAFATFLAIAVGIVWFLTYFRPRDFLHFVPAVMKPRLALWWDMLKIGLPAGAEFGLMAVYLGLVYWVSRRFGAAAQAGFGIGLRIVQSAFLPVVALGFSVAPVAGQNFGARRGDRVRQTFKTAAGLSVAMMAVIIVLCQIAPGALIRIFSTDREVIAVGEDYLRIVSLQLHRVGPDLRHVEHVPGARQHAAPAPGIARPPGAHRDSADRDVPRGRGSRCGGSGTCRCVSVLVHMVLNLYLLRREFRRRLRFDSVLAPEPVAARRLVGIDAFGVDDEALGR